MATIVNLDAMIPRADIFVDTDPVVGAPVDKITIHHLEHLFASQLRKPDFQRETSNWTPRKVVDLIAAFVDASLIPAIILWRSGNFFFVVDGAHRLSALMAWIKDDYGDRRESVDYFGGHISDEQKKSADLTRDLVKKEIRPYQELVAAGRTIGAPGDPLSRRLANLASNTILAQWVPATSKDVAEESFFTINQAATPIDPTERRIIRSRHAASAIAARAIMHGGTGHEYWRNFAPAIRKQITETARLIYQKLYEPELVDRPVTTLDVPVAVRSLPFVFDLVNTANDVSVPDSTSKRSTKDKLPSDEDGTKTAAYLKTVNGLVSRLTGDAPQALGLHPVVYFYTRSGAFQSTAFLAASKFIDSMSSAGRLGDFTKHRRAFEDFLIEHREAVSLIGHTYGSGNRSLPWIVRYYETILGRLVAGDDPEQLKEHLKNHDDFNFLMVPRPQRARRAAPGKKATFSAGTKTAAFFAHALPSGTRCGICGALVHRNSTHFDHKRPIRDGGGAHADNGRPVHPYCDSARDSLGQ